MNIGRNSFNVFAEQDEMERAAEDKSSVSLLDLIGLKRLNKMQQGFYEATGFSSGCLDAGGNVLNIVGPTEPVCMDLIRRSPLGLRRCKEFVQKCTDDSNALSTRVSRCHTGMLDGRIPIRVDGQILGFLVIGQVFDVLPSKERAITYAKEVGLNPKEYWDGLKQVQVVSRKKVEAAATLLEFMGNEIANLASANKQLKKKVIAYRKEEHKLAKQNVSIKDSLKESEEKYRSIMEAMDDSIVINSNDYLVEYMNPSMIQKVGRNCVGDLCYEAIHGLDEKCFWCPHEEIMEGKSKRADVFLPWDNRNYHVSSSPIFHVDGSISHLCVYRDITEIKSLEAQFLHAQKMESIGRLAGGIAHDFNNILSVIIGTAELALEDHEEGQQVYQDLTEIRKAGMRSADLTRQLLTFARKQNVTPEILSLNDTVSSLLKMLKRLIGENIDLNWYPGSDLWSISIDPSQVDQILANMCVNARDAIKKNGTITIETKNIVIEESDYNKRSECHPGDYVLLTISDNGRGMDLKTQNHVFEPFFTTKERGKGTGLGLATVYGIVKQNKGYIDLWSALSEGTSFKIYFPRLDSNANKKPTRNIEKMTSGSETILLVEDDASLLEVTKRMLERAGYLVLTSRDPSKVEHLIEKFDGTIDLLVTDVIMPKINGRELSLQVMRQLPDIKTLYASGYAASLIAPHGVIQDDVHFIKKPFNRQELTKAVRKALDS